MGNLVAESSATRVRAQAATNRVMSSERILVSPGERLQATCPIGAKYRILFFATSGTISIGTVYSQADSGLDDITQWHADNRTITVPDGAVSFAACLAFANDETISVATRPGLKISLITLGTTVADIADAASAPPTEIAAADGWQNMNLVPIDSGTSVRCEASDTAVGFVYRHNIQPVEQLLFDCPPNARYRCIFFDKSGKLTADTAYYPINTGDDDVSVWHAKNRILTVQDGAVSFAVNLIRADRAQVTPATRPALHIYRISMRTWVREVWDIVSGVAGRYSGKKLSILGDSISSYAGDGAQTAGDGHMIADGTFTYAGNHCRYPSGNVTSANDTYWFQLMTRLNLAFGVNESWAGSRVSWDGTEGSDVGADIYIASPTRIGHLDDNGTPDYILVNAGTNDIGNRVTVGEFNTDSPASYTDEQIASLPVATFADAYRALLIRLQKSYPLARIIAILPNFTTSYYDPQETDQYLEVIKEACDYFGVPWIDMRTSGITMYNTSTYLSDGIHPNVKGMKLLYQKVLSALETRM